MRRIIVILAALAAPTTPAVADVQDDLKILATANDLANLLASELPCGLSYDQAAIARYIEENVPPERMDFAANLSTATMGASYLLDKMSASSKTAHCTAITQTARHFGFIK